jgi:hypothetical protein
MGRILELTAPRMGALWHLDVTPGVDGVFDEVGANYRGPATVAQDFPVFNVTAEAVVARQANVTTPPHPFTDPPARTRSSSRGRLRRPGGRTPCSASRARRRRPARRDDVAYQERSDAS